MNRKLFLVVCVLGVLAAAVSSAQPAATVSDPITVWSQTASTAATASAMAPFRTPITLAILHLAMYDAVSAVTGEQEPYAVTAPVVHPASSHAAAIEAGYRVLLAEFPTQQKLLQSTYDTLLATVPDSPARRNGTKVGEMVASQLLRARVNDRRNATVPYTPGSGAGVWLPTPPGFLPVTTAFLAQVAPFTMRKTSQFRPAGPPRLNSKRWLADYNEVKTFGVKDDSQRTPEQTATALYWEPLAGTVWIPTIRRIAVEQGLDLTSSARFQAAAFSAFADGLIACWDAKFHFNFWRPVTAIQQEDPAWTPLAVTPNFPEYPSGHACVTSAVTHVIDDFFHNDVKIPTRNVVSGEERVFDRASDIVDEVVEARMLLGVHFRTADEDGADIGRKIARQIRRMWFKRRQ